MYLAQILGEVSEINFKNESSLILGKFRLGCEYAIQFEDE